MDENRLQSHAEHLAYKIGHIAWAYILLYLNINLGTIDVLPSWAGYLLILSSLGTLAEYVPSAELLRDPALLLAAWTAIDWVMTIFGLNSGAGGSFAVIYGLIGTIIGVVSIYFHFQMLTNLAEIAGQFNLEEHQSKLLRLRTINTVLQTILTVCASLAFIQAFLWLVLGLAVINCINTLRITLCLFDFRKNIGYGTE